MGAAVGTEGGGKSVNVEVNIVPFIDLMSCLTAFLLVTAAWVNIAQINIQPRGKSRDMSDVEVDDDKIILSVLIEPDQITMGLSRLNEPRGEPIKRGADGKFDWDKYEQTLLAVKKAELKDRTDMELAAESRADMPVKYQDIIDAMDRAIRIQCDTCPDGAKSFSDIGLTDPLGLSYRRSL